jgi:hypothetical protein
MALKHRFDTCEHTTKHGPRTFPRIYPIEEIHNSTSYSFQPFLTAYRTKSFSDRSWHSLTELRLLSLSGCRWLLCLPASFSRLTALQRLHLGVGRQQQQLGQDASKALPGLAAYRLQHAPQGSVLGLALGRLASPLHQAGCTTTA